MKQSILQQVLPRLVEKNNLNEAEIIAVMQEIMAGKCMPEQLGSFFTAMHMKGETVEEISGVVKVMKELATGVQIEDESAVDIVGTGGDGASLFNVSTAAALVCAGAGIPIAKHGNHGFSSSSGSASLLKEAGVNIGLNASQVKLCVDQLCIGFMFAPHYHSAMKNVNEIRKNLGFRTLMNLIGPLINPAGVKKQLTGVYNQSLCKIIAKVLANTGSKHVMIVHSEEGLDEISPVKSTFIVEYKAGQFNERWLDPKLFGVHYSSLDGLQVDSPKASLALIQEALGGGVLSKSAKKAADMIMLNAGVAIYISGKEVSLDASIKLARSVIRSGKAITLLTSLAKLSQSFA